MMELDDLIKLTIKEEGVDGLSRRLNAMETKYERVSKMRKSDSGKYTVIGIDKFDGEDWIEGKYESAKQALGVARKKTKEAMHLASDSSVATVYYAYDSDGTYLGGDAWEDKMDPTEP